MIVSVVGLLVLAVAGTIRVSRDWPLWTALRRVRPATPERLARAAHDGHLDGRIVAVTGIAGEGPAGPLASTVNEAPCVWHRHTVHKRQTRGYGRGRRVADRASTEAFVLRSALARVGAGAGVSTPPVQVQPTGMRVHAPVAGGTRTLPGLATAPMPVLFGGLTQAYRHREWTLPAGAGLLVLGELTWTAAGPVLCRPRRGPHLVSTRTHASVVRSLAVSVLGGLTLAVLGGATAAVVLAVHYL